MNLDEYKQFVQHRDKMEGEIVTLAIEYAKLFMELDTPGFRVSYDGLVEMSEEFVSIWWTWYGSYQSEDKGVITVETEILFGPKENWQPYIEKCIKEKKNQLVAEKLIKEEKNKQEEIAKAREVLKRYQENFLHGD